MPWPSEGLKLNATITNLPLDRLPSF